MLSKGGKEILIKNVAQMISNYAMSVFLFSIQLCTEMEQIMCKFWWRSSKTKDRSIHWMSWGKNV